MEDLRGVEFINSRERFGVPKRMEPPIDAVISRLVGRKIYAQDPRVMKLIVKWKGSKPADSMVPDNYLSDPRKVEELKSVLNQNL